MELPEVSCCRSKKFQPHQQVHVCIWLIIRVNIPSITHRPVGSPGVKLLLGKAPGHNSGLCASVDGGLAFSSMLLNEELVVGDEVIKDKQTLNALGFYVQPGLNYLQHVGNHIIVSANVSYYLGFEKGYYAEGDKDMKITHPDTGENIKPGWNGLRAGIVVYWGFSL